MELRFEGGRRIFCAACRYPFVTGEAITFASRGDQVIHRTCVRTRITWRRGFRELPVGLPSLGARRRSSRGARRVPPRR